MKRAAFNIGLVLTLVLFIAGCGKKAQPVTGGSGVVPQYSSAQLSPQISSMVNQMYGMRMDDKIRTSTSGLSSRFERWGCTNTTSTNTQTASWLDGILQATWTTITSSCPLALVGGVANSFQTADQNQATLTSGALLTKTGILDKIFNPDINSITKACAGNLVQIPGAVRTNVNGYPADSVVIDVKFREDCSNGQPYITHIISSEVNLSKPLAIHPISASETKVTQPTQSTAGQTTQVKIEMVKNFVY